MPLLTYSLAAAAGWLAGAAANYIAETYVQQRKLSRPACLFCGEQQPFAYLTFSRRCHFCASPRPVSAYLVEVLGVCAALAAGLLGASWGELLLALLLYIYAAVTILVDLRLRIVMLESHLPGAVLCAVIGLTHTSMPNVLAGAIILPAILAAYAFVISRMLRPARAMDDILGIGDLLLAGVLGLATGGSGIIGLLFFTSVAGILLAAGQTAVNFVTRRPFDSTMPFAPPMVAGLLLHLLAARILLP